MQEKRLNSALGIKELVINSTFVIRNSAFMRNNSGFSLIGLVIFLVVVGIALPPLLLIAYNAVNNSVSDEIMLNATTLATEQMENIKAMSFGNIASSGSQAFTGSFNKYSYSVNVIYVSPPNYDVDAGTQTSYKRVQV